MRTDAHVVPIYPYGVCKQYSVRRVDEVLPLVELRDVEVLAPQPHGTNGWCHTLAVRDVSGVVVCAVDSRSKRDLERFAEAVRSAIVAAHRAKPLPPQLLDGYRQYAALSWIGLERARYGIAHRTDRDDIGGSVPMGAAVGGEGGAGGVELVMGGPVVGGPVVTGAAAPIPQTMEHQPIQAAGMVGATAGVPVGGMGMVGAVGAPPAQLPPGGDPTQMHAIPSYGAAYPAVAGSAPDEKEDIPLCGAASSAGASADGVGPPPSMPPQPPAAPPGHETIGVRIPPEAIGMGMLQFTTPAGQEMQVSIPPGMVAGDVMHVHVPIAGATYASMAPPMAAAVMRPEPPGGWQPLTGGKRGW